MSSPTPPLMRQGIMAGIPAPPALSMEPSFSAPVSRVTTPPNLKRRDAISKPVSPVAGKPRSPIAKKTLPPVISPTRALRKHRYHVTFTKFNPRAKDENAPCPIHSYSTIEQEINAKPSSLQLVGRFPTFNPREREALCPIHSYATIEQEIAAKPSTAHGGVPFGDAPRDVLAPARANCPVHVYAEAKSTLSRMGTTAFGQAGQRDAFQQTKRALAPVHAYAAPSSTLRSTGGAAFGSSASRSNLLSSGALSRTGLLGAPSAIRRSAPSLTALAKPARQPMTLPKLVPPAATPVEEEAGEGSPRDIEALL